jgi:monofunctional biosynthetic peptidoglycan transglycosylase
MLLWAKRLGKGMLYFIAITVIWVLLYRFVNPPFTMLEWSQRSLTQEQLQKGKLLPSSDAWVPLERIPNSMELAVVCGEDQQFFKHHGFDFKAIRKAWEYNKTHSKKRGASTISQQCAKNVFLWEGRSWLRKGLEVYFTLLIETLWGKERIMEVYLNCIEFGRGAFGVNAAAYYYFKKSPQALSRYQCIQIASMMPCPRTCGLHSAKATRRAAAIDRAMRRYGIQLSY